jgi:uncharacterized protein YjbJ (UPF0337 family)
MKVSVTCRYLAHDELHTPPPGNTFPAIWNHGKGHIMGDGSIDKLKGRAKEAAGAATDDDDLRSEGKLDQTKGGFKDKVDDVADKVKDAAD